MSDKGPVLRVIVNGDLRMRTGKAASQVAHAAMAAERKTRGLSIYEQWRHSGEAVIVTSAPEETLRRLLREHAELCAPIFDEGRTQVAPGSLTALGFVVMNATQVPELTTHRLL